MYSNNIVNHVFPTILNACTKKAPPIESTTYMKYMFLNELNLIRLHSASIIDM